VLEARVLLSGVDLPWANAQQIVADTVVPSFPTTSFNVTAPQYGAVGDGTTDNTRAFSAAVADCSAQGGGHVIVPAGVYLTGAIALRSNVDLHLEQGAVLSFNGNVDEYPLVLTRYEGIECMNHSPMIYAYGQTNIALTGSGTLTALGTRSWNVGSDRAGILEPLVAAGVPPEQRIVPNYGHLRSTFVEPYDCSNVLIQGITLSQSQFWQLHPTLCSNVTVDSVTTGGTSNPNTDGCDPESCDHVVIKDCTLDANDDCIAIKSGRDDDGRRVNTPSQNIVIYGCRFQGPIGGITFGSELTGGIRNVYAYNDQTYGTGVGYMLFVKSNTRRGGYAINLNLDSIQADHLHGPWGFAQMDYLGQTGNYLPAFEDWNISNVTGDSDPLVFQLRGLPQDPIDNFNVSHSAFTNIANPASQYSNVADIHLDGVTVNGNPVSLLPTGWASADIGGPSRAGSASYNSVSRSWTVAGGGADIGGTADQFHLAAQSYTGDGSFTAQVTGVQNTDPGAKAGVMFRDSADPGAPFADVVATPGNGVAFQWRDTPGAVPNSVNIPGLSAPVWVQLVREGDAFSAFYSTDGVTWTQLGATQTITMSPTALAGLAVTAHNNAALNAATFTNVSLLPAGWADADIGSPGWPGYAYHNNASGTWTVAAGGADIGNTADQFHFASHSFTGDGSLTAQVTGVQNTDPGAKAGLMFRDSADPGAPFADVVATPGNCVAFQWRSTAGGQPDDVHITGLSAPLWVRLVRAGDAFSAYYSTDGVIWTQLGSTQTVAMNSTAPAGLAVTSHNDSALSAATFTHVSVLPAGVTDQDIGSAGVPGYTNFDQTDRFWTVAGSGTDIYGSADAFHFAWTVFSGAASLIAEVTAQANTDPLAKAGVMFRNSTDPGAGFADVVVTPGQGIAFESRDGDGGLLATTTVAGLAAPVWVQLTRLGITFSASYSTNGMVWTAVGSPRTVHLADSALLGLAVTAHNNARLSIATFAGVALHRGAPADLSASFNAAGIVADGTPFTGGLDGNGNAYSANLLGASLNVGDHVVFNLGAAGANNVVQAAGQTIALPQGQFNTLTFLGTAVNGAQPAQTFTVNYTDGTSDTFTQDMSDWQNPQGFAGESVAATLGYEDASGGSTPATANYLYQYSFALNNQKTVSSITLPDNGNVVLLAIDLLS
jgi:regulation of enolase protein 1 (concanavalin A-like superfamily)